MRTLLPSLDMTGTASTMAVWLLNIQAQISKATALTSLDKKNNTVSRVVRPSSPSWKPR